MDLFDFQRSKILEKIKESVFSVSEYLSLLNDFLVYQRAKVKGEIGKVDERRKWVYFTLKDKDGATMNCLIFKDVLTKKGFSLKEGQEAEVFGFPEIYKPQGKLTFRVDDILLKGEGILKESFLRLKEKLKKEGLFDKKRKIKKFCQKIGLLTSSYGEAKKDFLSHLGNFGFEIYFFDIHVEGEQAPKEIIQGIEFFNKFFPFLDVIVITRGGGSLESLQPFNQEDVARAVFASKIPVISAIGHERDETLVDLVADFRASTPTHAGKVLSEPWYEMRRRIKEIESNFFYFFEKELKRKRNEIKEIFEEMKKEIEKALSRKKEKISMIKFELQSFFKRIFEKYSFLKKEFFMRVNFWRKTLNEKIKKEKEKLLSSSPYLRLKQGWAVVFDKKGKIIKDPSFLKKGDEIEIKLLKGKILSLVKEVFKKD